MLLTVELPSGEAHPHDPNGEIGPPLNGFARVLVANEPAWRPDLVAPGSTKDSSVRFLMPDVNLDRGNLYLMDLEFWTGDSPTVFLAGGETASYETLERLYRGIARVLRDQEFGTERFEDLADDARWIPIWALRGKIHAIEDSVRAALDDEVLTTADYDALRGYPARLALVEETVATLQHDEPTWQSHRPRPAPDPYGLMPVVSPVDFFWKHLSEIGEEAREAVARLSGLISSQQIVLTQRQALQAGKLQRVVTLVGSAVLIPGLVAAIFGANVDFRGRNTADAFWAMLCFMVASGVGSYALFRSFELEMWQRLARKRAVAWLTRVDPETRVAVLAALALAAFAVGLIVL